MFNPKVGAVVAGIAFILSFLIALISGVSIPMLFIRPLILAAAFFLIACIVFFLTKNFLPELFEMERMKEDDTVLPGSRVNITEGDVTDTVSGLTGGNSARGQKQVFMGAQADDSEEGLGNISDLMENFGFPNDQEEATTIGMDHKAQDGYTVRDWEESSDQGQGSNFVKGASQADSTGGSAINSAKPAKSSISSDALPDLDSMAGAFLPNAAGTDSDTVAFTVSTLPKRP